MIKRASAILISLCLLTGLLSGCSSLADLDIIYDLTQQDQKDAWQRYYKLVKLAGTRTYRELVTSAGLNDPFEPAGLKAACEAAAKWLDGCDMTKIK